MEWVLTFVGTHILCLEVLRMSDELNVDDLLNDLGYEIDDSDGTDGKYKKRDIRIGTSSDDALTNSINSYLSGGSISSASVFNKIKSMDENRAVATNVVRTNFDEDLTDEQKEDALEFTKARRIETAYKMAESIKKSETRKLKRGSDGVIVSITALSFVTDVWYSLLMLLYGYKVSSLFRRFVEKGNKDCWLKDGSGGMKPVFSPIADKISFSICNIPRVGNFISLIWFVVIMLLSLFLGTIGVIGPITLLAFLSFLFAIFPIITVFVFIFNLLTNHDKELQDAYSNKSTFDRDLTSITEQTDKDYQDEVVKINNMTINDLTAKEKSAYLKHIGFVTKQSGSDEYVFESEGPAVSEESPVSEEPTVGEETKVAEETVN